ncbi:MBL fold metallo-hydrolase, partial [Gaiella sp.]|uniref:MBL fold metallo-hydrolase n=1 Tax=Gaiella sp. TaxID=2663207 RepID=UPI0039839B11
MLVGRSMHDQWLSNAYVLGDAPGGTAVFVDSGAPLTPLLELVERERLTPTHLLRTHAHADHVEHEDELCDRFGIPVVMGDLVTGGLSIRAIELPGHSDDGL